MSRATNFMGHKYCVGHKCFGAIVEHCSSSLVSAAHLSKQFGNLPRACVSHQSSIP